MLEDRSKYETGLSDADFQKIAELAEAHFGLSLQESKKPLVFSRLSKRLSERGVDSFKDYIALVSRENETSERQALISALTTNVTNFYREKHHFDLLQQLVLSKLPADQKRLRIWSAGCSTGQEAYTIAMTISNALASRADLDVKVLATDIDPKVLAKAENASYSDTEIRDIPPSERNRYFEQDPQGNGLHRVTAAVTSLVSFRQLNLIQDFPFSGLFDAIFCRNVAIYFSKQTQEQLWMKLAKHLKPGGLLFIGHSERLSGPVVEMMSNVGVTSYQRR